MNYNLKTDASSGFIAPAPPSPNSPAALAGSTVINSADCVGGSPTLFGGQCSRLHSGSRSSDSVSPPPLPTPVVVPSTQKNLNAILEAIRHLEGEQQQQQQQHNNKSNSEQQQHGRLPSALSVLMLNNGAAAAAYALNAAGCHPSAQAAPAAEFLLFQHHRLNNSSPYQQQQQQLY